MTNPQSTTDRPAVTPVRAFHDRHGVGWSYFAVTGVSGVDHVDIYTDAQGKRTPELWFNGSPLYEIDPQVSAQLLILTDVVHDLAGNKTIRCGLLPTDPVLLATDTIAVTCPDCRDQIERALPHLEPKVTAAAAWLADAVCDETDEVEKATDTYYDLRTQYRTLRARLGEL